MPAIYSHNKFGKKVITQLSPAVKQLIADYPRSFRLGLQGPDTLFFYYPVCPNKVNQYGVQIHKNDAYPFFEDAISVVLGEGLDSACHAYILGCICHFTLDQICHPYVNAAMEPNDCGHLEIEADFESYLMAIDGHSPADYRVDKLIPTDIYTASSMQPFYPDVTLRQVQTSMKHMKLLKSFLIAPEGLKRSSIDTVMHVNYNFFNGQMINIKANNKCRHCSEHLYQLFIQAVPEAVKRIQEFENILINGGELSDSFQGNFNSK